MLNQLTIRDYAIVDALDLELKPGMTVITGETGAGKSIILGALGLTLGDRADKGVVRAGSRQADISARFDLTDNPAAVSWLQERDLADPDNGAATCLIRRVVPADGTSRAYINGVPVTLGNLAELGEQLMDIHSQHEHHSLLRRSTHQLLLDEYGVDSGLLSDLHRQYRGWQHNQQLMKSLKSQAEEMEAQRQLISYQVEELDELDAGEDEFDSLEAEFQRLANADSSLATLQQVLTLCQDDENYNISQAIGQARTLLQSLSRSGLKLDSTLELLETAAIQVDEAAGDIQDQLDQVEVNPERQQWVDERLAALHRVARKHKIQPDQLYRLHQDLSAQLQQLTHSDRSLQELQKQDAELRSGYEDLASQVSRQRKQAAKKLATSINTQLSQLGMGEARLEVKLQAIPGTDPSPQGLESAEFLVKTNPGQPPRALGKIASGGELSRISLAIQVITAQTSQTPTLVFDEVDVGIGGGVARAVGKLLRQLADHTQILCVTHQAQVASQGQHHLVVSKETRDKSTRTTITRLNDQDRVKEIARMLGGDEVTEESLAHAEQMVASP
ncbi:MAG: DNA repair protein RecN [Gammaproteobacteria bacterium]|nr:DNA repair protein RecN [Pseudomonadales bacterium]MCP5347079.1 DNA repair protein RecN [Pseudomonadales bacterium]